MRIWLLVLLAYLPVTVIDYWFYLWFLNQDFNKIWFSLLIQNAIELLMFGLGYIYAKNILTNMARQKALELARRQNT